MGATSFAVREATPDDAAGITDVHIASWQVAYAHIFPAEQLRGLSELEERRAEFWRRTIAANDLRSHTLVAAHGERIVGFVDVRPSPDGGAAARVGELTAIYALPGTWGTGVGRHLMAAALERLSASGFEEATLWVFEDNPRARRFYEAAGWVTDGSVKEDEFLGTAVREVRYRISLSRSVG